VKVRFNFAGSPELRTQLEHGAPADVFASADTRQMDGARTAGSSNHRSSSPPTSQSSWSLPTTPGRSARWRISPR
jgi:ABC-type molybdate transport system substrate-binding protein